MKNNVKNKNLRQNLKNTKLKQNRGITLIALIITIIVLLILTGVSIAMLAGENGILKRAGEASETTKDVNEEEQVKLAIAEALTTGKGKITDETLRNSIGNMFGEAKKENLTGTGPWVYKGEMKKYNIEGNGKIEEIEERDLSKVDKSILSLKTGEYIKYDTGISSIGENGVETFRVLYPVDSEYGLQIISNSDLEEVTLGGDTVEEARESYNGAIKTLNMTTEKYLNEEFATDTRCVGSLPNLDVNGNFTNKNDGSTETFKVSEFLKSADENGWWTCPIPNDRENISVAEGVEDDTGFLCGDSNFRTDISVCREMFEWNDDFWLASRQMMCDYATGDYGQGFYVDSMLGECGTCFARATGRCSLRWDCNESCLTSVQLGNVGGRTICEKGTLGIRPCIALKYNDIRITDGNGSENVPYVNFKKKCSFF